MVVNTVLTLTQLRTNSVIAKLCVVAKKINKAANLTLSAMNKSRFDFPAIQPDLFLFITTAEQIRFLCILSRLINIPKSTVSPLLTCFSIKNDIELDFSERKS
jgi:hypothetical protein